MCNFMQFAQCKIASDELAPKAFNNTTKSFNIHWCVSYAGEPVIRFDCMNASLSCTGFLRRYTGFLLVPASANYPERDARFTTSHNL